MARPNTCRWCGAPFTTSLRHRQTCSDTCADRLRRHNKAKVERSRKVKKYKPVLSKTCHQCGVTYATKFPNKRFCCRACCMTWQNSARVPRQRALVCRVCHDTYTTKTRSRSFYCSDKCANTAGNMRKVRTHRVGDTLDCKWCGAPFTMLNGARKYCGDACASLGHTESRRKLRAERKVTRPRTRPVKAPVIGQGSPSTSPAAEAYPCASCAHGRVSTVADTGWECAKVWAGLCKPWGSAIKFERKGK